jgi:hypothetical protein
MAFEIATGEQRWTAAGHPLLNFFRLTHHPDIDIRATDDVGGMRRAALAERHAPRFSELAVA